MRSIYTLEIVEEILFRVCEIRVRKRGRESVEVEGRIHAESVVGDGQSGKNCRSAGAQPDRCAMLPILIVKFHPRVTLCWPGLRFRSICR